MFQKKYKINEKIDEWAVWELDIFPLLDNLPKNARNIWHYGFTEIFNNAIDHSNGYEIEVTLFTDEKKTQISIEDNGSGIFHKIQKELDLHDPRLSIFELSKGKLTTSPENHSGEGIFFTSKMMEQFSINSRNIEFSCKESDTLDILTENSTPTIQGTRVSMLLINNTDKTVRRTFDKYVTDKEEYNFDKTIIPLRLAAISGDSLISRSQAKRVLSRIDKFKYVMLDFSEISEIGQGFADEIFRVYDKSNPEVFITGFNMNDNVTRMISRVRVPDIRGLP